MSNSSIRNLLLCAFFIAMIAAGMFLTSSLFVDNYVVPKWYAVAFCACGLMITYVVFSFFTAAPSVDDIIGASFPIITIACVLQAIYGILYFTNLYPYNGGKWHAGSFDNPAGFAASLSAGLPCLLYFLYEKKRWVRISVIVAMAIIAVAICLSGSRSGIISLMVVGLVMLLNRISAGSARLKFVLLFLTVLILGYALYLFKKDSAKGRLLIWRCSWEMIKDEPLAGHGLGGFKARYMDYQARYFERNPGDGEYGMLADNTVRPFNEYLLLLTNFGFTGLVLFLSVAWLIFKAYQQQGVRKPLYIPLLCLLSISVFALFSYPLTYPFVWIMGLLSIILIVYHPVSSVRRTPIVMNVLKGLLVLLSIITCAGLYPRMRAEMEWREAANNSLAGKTAQMLPSYKKLYNHLSGNVLFLYNYAAELNVAEQYGESLIIAKKCEQLWQNYHIQLLMADNYKEMQRYRDAEIHYWKASAMCPARFIPLYEIVQIYIATNQPESKILNVATKIIHKKVKIQSETVSMIKEQMHELIKADVK